MADSVTSATLYEDSLYYIGIFTNISDGSGETTVKKIDVSALSPACSCVSIEEIWYNTFGMSVSVLFDATTDDKAIVLQGDGHFDFRQFGGVKDPKSTGWVGDVLFTTNGASNGDTYSIVLKCKKY